MDQISAAAAAGDDDTVARLTAQANLEDIDRRQQSTPLPTVDGDALAAEKVRHELQQRVLRARARRDVHGETDALARLHSFEENLTR